MPERVERLARLAIEHEIVQLVGVRDGKDFAALCAGEFATAADIDNRRCQCDRFVTGGKLSPNKDNRSARHAPSQMRWHFRPLRVMRAIDKKQPLLLP
jgi:hypothetical protein